MTKKSSINSKIDLSVVIVNYNTGKLVRECVESIKKDTFNFSSPRTEIVLIDNNSPENGLEDFPLSNDTKIILNKENVGFAKAVNQGIREKKGEYVLLLNPDSKVSKGAINTLFEFAKSTPDAGVVGAKLLNSDGSIQDSVMHFPTITRAIQEFWIGSKVYSKYVPPQQDVVEVDAVVGAAFLVTPRALKRVGLLKEEYFMYFEDLDYCKRVWESGLRVYYHPGAEIIHYHGASGKGLVKSEDQWKRLIPSSIIYHGWFKHYLVNWIIKFGTRLIHR